uniref:Uncharacterized protein n=1 Tax=Solanum tuberosum TaxID=4113 RepID=M1DFG2_SOLTU
MREIVIDGLNPTLHLVLVVVGNKIVSMFFKLKKVMRIPQMRLRDMDLKTSEVCSQGEDSVLHDWYLRGPEPRLDQRTVGQTTVRGGGSVGQDPKNHFLTMDNDSAGWTVGHSTVHR